MQTNKKYNLIEDRLWDKENPTIINRFKGTENECMEWIHKHTSFSFYEALKNQGFRLEEVLSREQINKELEESFNEPDIEEQYQGVTKAISQIMDIEKEGGMSSVFLIEIRDFLLEYNKQ